MGEKIKNIFMVLLVNYFRILVISVVIILFALGYFFLVGPKYKSIRGTGVLDYKAKQSQLSEREDYLEQLEKMVGRYKKIDLKKVEKLELVLPKEQDIPGLFVQIEALTQSVGLTLNSISVAESASATTSGSSATTETIGTKKENNITNSNTQSLLVEPAEAATTTVKARPLAVNVMVSGAEGYNKLKTFLDALEKNMRIFDVSSISFTPEGTSYSLVLKTYYSP